MFTVIAIVCSLNDPTVCFSITNRTNFTTLKACQTNAYTAQGYAEVNNLQLKNLACYNWGKPT